MALASAGRDSPAEGLALPFIAVGRVKDGVILAYHSAADMDEQRELHKDVFRKLLGAAATKLAHGQRTRLQWNEGSVCCLMDQQGALLYCAMTTLLTYPERLAYQLLYDLVVAVQQLGGAETTSEEGLNEALMPRMRELVNQYEDPNNFPSLQVAMDKINQPPSFDAGHSGGGAHFDAQMRDARKSRMIKFIVFAAVLICIILLYVFLYLRGGSSAAVGYISADAVTSAVGRGLPAAKGLANMASQSMIVG